MLIKRRSVMMLAPAMAIAVACRSASAKADDNQGPFGLIYGSSTEDVQQSGARLDPLGVKSDWGASFTATGLSRVLSDMDSPVISFGFRNRLWRVAAPGRTVTSDPYGNSVVARYEELKSSLSQRYGRGEETDMRDTEIWKGADEYIMSIKQGRANRFTTFLSDSASVELSIRAIDSDSAYYLIIYASRSEQRTFNLDKKSHENSAL